ncbi:MAG: NADH-quinone oxidoreductase subunit NuoN [Nocardioidaceae bacterium]|nr:MAG: NADH-quinone oxidoreductase subunit NuoN [Nocardioidaceae bacterium]
MNDFVKPDIAYGELSPLLIMFGFACLGVLVEAFVPRERRHVTQMALALLGMVAALVATVVVWVNLGEVTAGAKGSIQAEGAIAVDGPAVFLWTTILLIGVGGALLFAERRLYAGVSAFAGQAAALPGTEAEREASAKGLEHTEIYPLMLFSVFGMLLFTASNDLLTMFVALEILSLPLYLLCGLARRRRLLSQEAALKYFLLGAFSSAFFLYGMALTYGYAGSFKFADISQAIEGRIGADSLLLVGIGLVAVGLLFKVGAVPFHSWTPDVYQGAPTAVTAFMSAATKIAAFGALLRLFYVAFGSAREDWAPMIWVVAILTMLVGTVLALTQTDMKRMLAYSSVAHAGFALVGFVGLQQADGSDAITSLQAVLFYLVAYGFTVIAAFAIVTLVRDANGEAGGINRWAGLGKQSPVVAGVFSFLLLAMAGIPLTSGFIGKWAVFASAAQGGAWPLVVVAVVVSAMAAFFYVRVILAMYFSDPEPGAEGAAVSMPSPLTAIVIAVGFAVTVVLGVVPGLVLDLAGQVGQFIR